MTTDKPFVPRVGMLLTPDRDLYMHNGDIAFYAGQPYQVSAVWPPNSITFMRSDTRLKTTHTISLGGWLEHFSEYVKKPAATEPNLAAAPSQKDAGAPAVADSKPCDGLRGTCRDYPSCICGRSWREHTAQSAGELRAAPKAKRVPAWMNANNYDLQKLQRFGK